MDRRWMGIFIIFLVGVLGLAMIVDTSDTVGQAVTVCNEMTVTIPDGFKLFLSNPTNTTLINNENETIKNIAYLHRQAMSRNKYKLTRIFMRMRIRYTIPCAIMA